MNLHSILIVAVVAIVTIALRFLTFFIFGGKKETPEVILYLGKVLPYAIMGMLVVYCLRSIPGGSITAGALPAFLAAFGSRKRMSDAEIEDLKKIIDGFRR